MRKRRPGSRVDGGGGAGCQAVVRGVARPPLQAAYRAGGFTCKGRVS